MSLQLWTIVIGSLSIVISVVSMTLAIRNNYRMGLDWRFRPLDERRFL